VCVHQRLLLLFTLLDVYICILQFPHMLGSFQHICTCTCTIYCGIWPPDNISCTFITWYQSPGLGLIFSDAQLVRDFSTFLDSDLGFWPSPASRPLSPPSSAHLLAIVLSVLPTDAAPDSPPALPTPLEDLRDLDLSRRPPRSFFRARTPLPLRRPSASSAVPSAPGQLSAPRPSAPGQLSAPRPDLSRNRPSALFAGRCRS
jgi:hypothetical protein